MNKLKKMNEILSISIEGDRRLEKSLQIISDKNRAE